MFHHSLSLNCLEWCSGDTGYGDHCTGSGCPGPTCGASQGNGDFGETRCDTGSENGESLAKSSGFKDGDLDGSIGQFAGETRIDCMSNCTACQDEFFATCQEITDGLNYDKFDYRGRFLYHYLIVISWIQMRCILAITNSKVKILVLELYQ